MIKKFLVAACVVTLYCGIAHGQAVKATFGIKGMGVATLTNTEITPTNHVQYGGGGGVFTGLIFGKVLGIHAEALYSYQIADYYYETNYSLYTSYNSVKQYINIPVCLQLWCGRNFAFEFGYEQSIAFSGTINNGSTVEEDAGILDYGSLVGGIVINMGKVVFLNIRYVHALDYSYVMTTEPSKCQSLQVGLGFRFYTSRKSVFK